MKGALGTVKSEQTLFPYLEKLPESLFYHQQHECRGGGIVSDNRTIFFTQHKVQVVFCLCLPLSKLQHIIKLNVLKVENPVFVKGVGCL